jgi:hypothetical protein
MSSMSEVREEGEAQYYAAMKTYSILYSYPTWDRYYRGQRGERIEAASCEDAINRIRRGEGSYGPCPDAQIVRCKELAV